MRRAFAAMLAFVVLAACGQTMTTAAQTPAASPSQPQVTSDVPAAGATDDFTAPDTCGAGAYRRFIGARISSMTPPPNSRVIRPGDPVTEDFRTDRLNIVVDADGFITSLECR
jgi:hypothetical protein